MRTQKSYHKTVLRYTSLVDKTALNRRVGRIVAVQGTNIVACVPSARLGEVCKISMDGDETTILGQIVSIDGDLAKLCVAGETAGIAINSRIIATGSARSIKISNAWLGRTVDGNGQFLDEVAGLENAPISEKPTSLLRSLHGKRMAPLQRSLINKPLPSGIRAIDGLLTLGMGQRIGIFGEPGAGKSILLGMIARGCEADVVVLGLIGERGREVGEFLENELPGYTRSRCVTVVSTSDSSPLERIWGAQLAITVAEHFREQGKNVLLMIDSVTRFARARREVALQAGELPVRQGYPPSVFDELPKLLERAGRSKSGSITGIYTVLHDGDRQNDIISEEIKSLLDGHIQLSHELAAASHYPAIDILTSKSRVMKQVTSSLHQESATKTLQLLAKYNDVKFLVQVGEYKRGTDSLADLAIDKHEEINEFLLQKIDEKSNYMASVNALKRVVQ